jgi:hypothetical protein
MLQYQQSVLWGQVKMRKCVCPSGFKQRKKAITAWPTQRSCHELASVGEETSQGRLKAPGQAGGCVLCPWVESPLPAGIRVPFFRPYRGLHCHTHTHMHIHMHTCMHTCTRIHIHTHIRTCTHTHTHTHTHTRYLGQSPLFKVDCL